MCGMVFYFTGKRGQDSGVPLSFAVEEDEEDEEDIATSGGDVYYTPEHPYCPDPRHSCHISQALQKGATYNANT